MRSDASASGTCRHDGQPSKNKSLSGAAVLLQTRDSAEDGAGQHNQSMAWSVHSHDGQRGPQALPHSLTMSTTFFVVHSAPVASSPHRAMCLVKTVPWKVIFLKHRAPEEPVRTAMLGLSLPSSCESPWLRSQGVLRTMVQN